MHAKDYPPGKVPGYRPTRAAPPAARDSGHHTTSIAVIDRRGNAVAVTCSLGDWFGSAVVARGTAFALNDALNTFTPPGTPNEPRGGKRAVWVLDPEIVARHGRAVLAAGGAGNVTIPPGVTAFISNVVDFHMGLARAVDVARGLESCVAECPVVETFGLSPGMALEDGRVRQRVIDRLAERGHSIVNHSGEYGLGPVVEAVGTDRASGKRVGLSDPRDSPGATAQR
jgi:gamma-glutamyltranspeptidase